MRANCAPSTKEVHQVHPTMHRCRARRSLRRSHSTRVSAVHGRSIRRLSTRAMCPCLSQTCQRSAVSWSSCFIRRQSAPALPAAWGPVTHPHGVARRSRTCTQRARLVPTRPAYWIQCLAHRHLPRHRVATGLVPVSSYDYMRYSCMVRLAVWAACNTAVRGWNAHSTSLSSSPCRNSCISTVSPPVSSVRAATTAFDALDDRPSSTLNSKMRGTRARYVCGQSAVHTRSSHSCISCESSLR